MPENLKEQFAVKQSPELAEINTISATEILDSVKKEIKQKKSEEVTRYILDYDFANYLTVLDQTLLSQVEETIDYNAEQVTCVNLRQVLKIFSELLSSAEHNLQPSVTGSQTTLEQSAIESNTDSPLEIETKNFEDVYDFVQQYPALSKLLHLDTGIAYIGALISIRQINSLEDIQKIAPILAGMSKEQRGVNLFIHLSNLNSVAFQRLVTEIITPLEKDTVSSITELEYKAAEIASMLPYSIKENIKQLIQTAINTFVKRRQLIQDVRELMQKLDIARSIIPQVAQTLGIELKKDLDFNEFEAVFPTWYEQVTNLVDFCSLLEELIRMGYKTLIFNSTVSIQLAAIFEFSRSLKGISSREQKTLLEQNQEMISYLPLLLKEKLRPHRKSPFPELRALFMPRTAAVATPSPTQLTRLEPTFGFRDLNPTIAV